MIEALHYNKRENGAAECGLCPHGCVIADGNAGFCGVRVNRGGVLYAETYGLLSACALDPIEKKPLYHFFPGSRVLSIGSIGCNFCCAFCQNHSISMAGLNQIDGDFEHYTPSQIIALAEQLKRDGNIGLAYTYNEPLIGYEFVMDCSVLAKEKGLKNIVVTNGYINPVPLCHLLPYIDAMNIDLKGFTDAFYRRVKGHLKEVTETITLSAAQTHVEVTTLIIPDENDNDDTIDALARFVAGINPDIPLHLSRFFPNYNMTTLPPTPKETILRLQSVAKRHLHYVYAGNMR